jgi:hypothetical protein
MIAADELTTANFDAITFLPCVCDGTGRTGYSFGAHATDGTALEAFSHDWCAFRKPEPAVLHLNGTAIYGGMLMNHFGHFLVEAMARLWFIRERPELPILWHWIDLPVPHTSWRGWVWRLLGLSARRHHMIRTPLRCETVTLPRSGFFACSAFHAALLAASLRARLLIVERPSVYETVATARGLERHYISAGIETRGPINAWTTFRLSDPTTVADAVLAAAGPG